MKYRYTLLVVFIVVLFACTGCDRITSLLEKQEEKPDRKPSAAPVPTLQILGVTPVEQKAIGDMLEIRGLLQQAEDYVVIINTQLVRKGEALSMKVQDNQYRVEVASISEMKVVLKASKK